MQPSWESYETVALQVFKQVVVVLRAEYSTYLEHMQDVLKMIKCKKSSDPSFSQFLADQCRSSHLLEQPWI